MPKRLVVCFDGTWKGPTDQRVTNVERLARTIAPRDEEGRPQLVTYVGGVGTSYRASRLLGGLWGFGLTTSITNAYRHLALNYEAGDEVYLFGFSRGAFAARSLAGMIDRVGLLTPRALVEGNLPGVVEEYARRRRTRDHPRVDTYRELCHPHVRIELVGVFDTVGALAPGTTFHYLELSDCVRFARQALALGDRRMVFDPQLWTGGSAQTEIDAASGRPRVQQVWFEGSHSDVGGGTRFDGLSNTTLLWMAHEARTCGLVFDLDLLRVYLASQEPPVAGRSTGLAYHVDNALRRLVGLLGRPHPRFRRSRRVLAPPGARDVSVARPVAARLADGSRDWPEVRRWWDGFPDGAAAVTDVVDMPVPRTRIGDLTAVAPWVGAPVAATPSVVIEPDLARGDELTLP